MAKEHNEPVRSSQLDLDQLHQVIKKTFVQLDVNLRHIVKDDSGSVCVSIHRISAIFFLYNSKIFLDYNSYWSRKNLFN